ncbi:unannotated protein [freshwater metagenome]|uniref:Unannotated protein n=1 Tax=freshwater metagenome TaxID=449393 RepID=A0A6J6Z4L2_9ZZZZ|nr:DUF4389 domain-containing protein [Actinomycetota bacterium]MSX70730.1 DUF4389 domain-containing protein [Actinomycetota bacterium]
MSNQIETSFQVQLNNRDRATAFARIILAFPVFIFVSAFSIETFFNSNSVQSYGLVVLPVILALLFRGVYPSYVLVFNKAIFALVNRVWAYIALLTDEYPSIEESDVVRIVYPEVDGGKTLSRGLPLIKWFLAIPLYIVGIVYSIYGFIMLFLAWLNILFTGTIPETSADVIVRVTQYWNRIYGYAIILVTDEYPSFSL